MTTDKNNSPLPAPIDVTDPWRGLYQATRLPAPTEYGDIAHPDIPCWPNDREDALDKLVQAQGFDFQVVAGEFTEAALEEGDELYWAEMRAWTPVAPPEGEWRLAWKGDTEDGPYAWFVRPMALRPEPVALAATGKQQPSTFDGGGEYYADQHGDGAWATYRRDGNGWVYNFGHAEDAEVRAKSVSRELNRQVEAIAARQPGAQLAVWCGPMPESNGRQNWTAMLYRKGGDIFREGSMQIERSEYPDRVRYEADRLRYLIGERDEEPDIMKYDANLRSGYVEPPAQGIDLGQQQDAARWRAIAPHLSVEWDEDDQLKRWTWLDFKGDAPTIPSPTRQEYSSVDEAVDALISQRGAAPGVSNG